MDQEPFNYIVSQKLPVSKNKKIIFCLLFSIILLGLIGYYFFEKTISPTTPAVTTAEKKIIAIFADENTYTALIPEINRLADDIRVDLGADVIVNHANYTSAMQIRSLLQSYHKDNKLLGALLIGKIPTFYQSDGFYTDWFYQELSDTCPIDTNGKYPKDDFQCTTLSAGNYRYVFSGRITPPVGGLPGTALIKKYLDKNHDYRVGKLKFDQKMLIYPSVLINSINAGHPEITNSLESNLAFTLSRLDSYKREQVDLIKTQSDQSSKKEYLTDLKNNRYETAIINVHGTATSQWVGGDTNIDYKEIIQAAPKIFFASLLSCSNGAFKENNYLAGWFLFSGDSLLVSAQSAVAAIAGILADPPIEPTFFMPFDVLALGAPVGEITRRDNTLFITQIFGDPTLRMRPLITTGPKIETNSTLDFGQLIGGNKKTLTLHLKNSGSQTLKIKFLPSPGIAVDGSSPFSEFKDPSRRLKQPDQFFDTVGFGLQAIPVFQSYEIQPNEEKELQIDFAPLIYEKTKQTKTGHYSGILEFMTNDPTQPFLEVFLKGEGI